MKKFIIMLSVLTAIMYAMPIMAQEQTLFSGKTEFGGFGGPVWKTTMLNDDWGLMMGGRGGWSINHVLSIGGGGYGLTTNIPAPVSDRYLNFGYGGGIVEVILASDKVIHLTTNVLVGGGGVNFRKDWEEMNGDWEDCYRCSYDKDYDPDFTPTDSFFVIEPGVELEINVAKFFRVGLGVSYRYINGIETEGLKDKDLSGISANVILKFGKF